MYLQTSGGPIGLELTGAVSRPFMMKWDKLYLDKVKKAGMEMVLYERYVDDSNQVAVVPPPGSKYDKVKKKVLIENGFEPAENENDRLARVLKDIANTVHEDIVMEEDHPGKYPDEKMPILDMKVWMDTNGIILYQHYQKPMSSKQVMHSQSALSNQCKRSVHTQEVVRRLLNSSVRLNWDTEMAPVITEYMGRMKVAGYGQSYRKSVLQRAYKFKIK